MATVQQAVTKAHGPTEAMSSQTGLPSDMALCLRNLRLLDLHQLPDWPDVHVDTFQSSRDALARARSRVKQGEWLLYRLFELWDVKDTKMRLASFFPTLEPRQAVQLHANILTMLAALKQAGALGKECTLRKGMLDDCKGERFEEVLFYFSTAVLNKVLKERARRDRDLRHTLASVDAAAAAAAAGHGHLKPLSLANEAALSGSLRQRLTLRQRLKDLETSLKGKEIVLQSRKSQSEASAISYIDLLDTLHQDPLSLKKRLRKVCNGSDYINIAISGDANTDRDASFEVPFQDLWDCALEGREPRRPTVEPTILVELERRLDEQKARLDNWRAFQTTLSKRNEEFTVLRSPSKTPLRSPGKRSPMKSHKGTPSGLVATPRSPSKRGMESPLKQIFVPPGNDEHTAVSAGSESSQIRDTQLKSPIRLEESALQTSSMLSGAIPFDMNNTAFAYNRLSSGDASFSPPYDNDAQESPLPIQKAAEVSLQAPITPPTKPSLSERARLSMAMAGGGAEPCTRAQASSTARPSSPTKAAAAPPSSFSVPYSLAERTRESLSFSNFATPAPTPPRRKGSTRGHGRSRSSIVNHPINPWEAAEQRPRRSSMAVRDDGQWEARPQTPPEALLSGDVDADSIFKTRNKLRTSPVGWSSPTAP